MGDRFKKLDDLPMFAGDDDLATALLGTGKITVFRSVVPLLEARGFPKVDGLMGGRYVPAVRAFFNREYRVNGEEQISKPHSPAKLGASHGQRRTAAGS